MSFPHFKDDFNFHFSKLTAWPLFHVDKYDGCTFLSTHAKRIDKQYFPVSIFLVLSGCLSATEKWEEYSSERYLFSLLQ